MRTSKVFGIALAAAGALLSEPVEAGRLALGAGLGLHAGASVQAFPQFGEEPLLLARASEDDLFGGGDEPAAQAEATPVAAESLGVDARGLGSSSGGDAFSRGDSKVDPLAVGGTLYQTLSVPFARGLTEGEQSLRLPLQVDLYLDGRPNDRLRAYVVGRLLYDGALDSAGKATAGSAGFTVPGASTATAGTNPSVVLDQAWLKFDLGRVAYVSLGKQHVKWGAGRIWNPSDALNPQRRDPLQPYDLRLGSTMASVQLPWEAQSANLYAVLLFDNPKAASTLQQLGGAVRVEGLLGPAEVGLSAVGRAGERPRYGADLSMPLGPFDFYTEAAFLSNDGGLATDQWLGIPSGVSGTPSLTQIWTRNGLPGSALQASVGLGYSFSWTENRLCNLGLEYFYNELGADDAHLYPILLYQGRYTPFYLGRHYAALSVNAEGPDSGKKTNYTFSAISNLSDGTVVTRLDFRWTLLDYLSYGAWASGNWGNRGGEFNFSLDTPRLTDGSTTLNAIRYEGNSGEAGMSLRMSF